MKLPTAKDGIGIAFGAEYREEGLNFETDTAFTTGDLAGQGGPTIGVSGGYNVTDLFAEVRIPLLQDIFLAQDLTVTASYRYSDYSLDETTNTYGIGLDWSIVDDVRLRGSYQHAVRAPNVIELYSAAVAGPVRHDPRPLRRTAYPTATLEQCQNTGLRRCAVRHRTSTARPASTTRSSVATRNSSRRRPTRGRRASCSRPTFVDGLAVTIDYWNIKVEDTIGTVPPATALDQCLLTGRRRVLQPDHARQPGDAVAAVARRRSSRPTSTSARRRPRAGTSA